MMAQRRQQGVALAVVMWFIAGMSLLVAGIVAHARVDLQLAQVHVARAKAVAAGDGAIRLALADHTVGREAAADAARGEELLPRRQYTLGEIPVEVQMHPITGLVNLNGASAEMLAGLFALAAGMAPGDAAALADNVLKWRQPRDAKVPGRAHGRRLHSIEDLLQVEGMSRSVVDGVRNYAVAADWASGEVDWSAVPQDALQLLEQVNPGRLDAVLRRRDNRRQMQPARQGRKGARGGIYRVDALVQYGDNTWVRRRWVAVGSGDSSGLPWNVLRTEPPRIVNNDKTQG